MTVPSRTMSAALLVLLGSAAAGAGPQVPQAQTPTFRGGISLVPVDVRVIDREGKPISDLKQEDFTILEDNVPQVIRHFSTLAFTANVPATNVAPALRAGPSNTLASENRRVFLLVMGRGRHQDASKYVDALADFVGSRILPQDHVAMLAWNRATDFTTDHELMRRTLIRFRDAHAKIEAELRSWFSGLRGIYGAKGIPPHIQKMIDAVFAEAGALRPRPLAPSAIADAGRTDQEIRQTAMDIQRNAELNERTKAGFKTLPDLGASLTAGFTDLTFDEYIAKMTETLQDAGNLYAGIGYLRFLSGEKHLIFVTQNGVSLPRQEGNASLARVAADARIALDLVQTGGVIGLPPPVLLPTGGIKIEPWSTTDQHFGQVFMIQDLRLMADRTGGQLMAFRTGEDAFRRLDEAIKFQYLLGYTPTNLSLDGSFRKITVKVNRPGARVLTREGYVATEATIGLDRREMITFNRIRAAAEFVNVVDHIKVRLGRPAMSPRELAVDVTVDISRLKFAAQDDRREATLDVALFCGDEKEQQVGELTRRVELRLGDAEFVRAQQQGVTFRLTAPLRGVASAIKVVVYDYGADLVGTAVAKVSR